MTPEERASDILRRCWVQQGEPDYGSFRGLDVEIAEQIRAAVEEALKGHHCDSCDGSALECWNDKRGLA